MILQGRNNLTAPFIVQIGFWAISTICNFLALPVGNDCRQAFFKIMVVNKHQNIICLNFKIKK